MPIEKYNPNSIDYSWGLKITDPESHNKGSSCFTPRASVQTCDCTGAKWFTHEEALAQPANIRSRLTLRAIKIGCTIPIHTLEDSKRIQKEALLR